MSIDYPLSFPDSTVPVSIEMEVRPGVGYSESDFAPGGQSYDWGTEKWYMQATMPPMKRVDAEKWVAWLLSLRGMAGSFLAGEPGYAGMQGNWNNPPTVNGDGQTGRELALRANSPGQLGIAGDLFQLGSGADSRLHKLLTNFTADGSGHATLDITPALRYSPADGLHLVQVNPVGLWMLDSNQGRWSIGSAMIYGISFTAMEDLRGL